MSSLAVHVRKSLGHAGGYPSSALAPSNSDQRFKKSDRMLGQFLWREQWTGIARGAVFISLGQIHLARVHEVGQEVAALVGGECVQQTLGHDGYGEYGIPAGDFGFLQSGFAGGHF